MFLPLILAGGISQYCHLNGFIIRCCIDGDYTNSGADGLDGGDDVMLLWAVGTD